MATIPFTRVTLPNTADFAGVDVFEWAGMTASTRDVGEPIAMTGSADRSVQVTGAFGRQVDDASVEVGRMQQDDRNLAGLRERRKGQKNSGREAASAAPARAAMRSSAPSPSPHRPSRSSRFRAAPLRA